MTVPGHEDLFTGLQRDHALPKAAKGKVANRASINEREEEKHQVIIEGHVCERE